MNAYFYNTTQTLLLMMRLPLTAIDDRTAYTYSVTRHFGGEHV